MQEFELILLVCLLNEKKKKVQYRTKYMIKPMTYTMAATVLDQTIDAPIC